jgi:hypothetical protein
LHIFFICNSLLTKKKLEFLFIFSFEMMLNISAGFKRFKIDAIVAHLKGNGCNNCMVVKKAIEASVDAVIDVIHVGVRSIHILHLALGMDQAG